MLCKTVPRMIVILLLLSMLTLDLNTHPILAWNGTVYIEADGSVTPPDAPIYRDGNIYTLTDNINSDADGIVVERNDIVIDGANHAIQGAVSGNGIYVSNVNNVTIKNVEIRTFDYGISLEGSSGDSIFGNNITNNYYGFWLFSSSNIGIVGNDITANNYFSIQLVVSSNYNIIFHNNFEEEYAQVYVDVSSSSNVWDNGYPSGGNHWSNYTGVDYNSSPNQNIIGSDGIGDVPYGIDQSNTDHYPLMKPYAGPYDIGITEVNVPKTVVGQGLNATTIVKIINYGEQTETFNVAIKANSTTVHTLSVTLAIRNSTTVTFKWNTTGFAKGNYTVSAYAGPVLGETDTSDNTFTDHWVVVGMVGDLTGGTTNPWDFVPDKVVDGSDLIVVSRCFGSWPTAPPPMKWNANCDITNDNVVDGSDLIVVSKHFGQKDP